MGRRKDLTDAEKGMIIKELANSTTPEVIAQNQASCRYSKQVFE